MGLGFSPLPHRSGWDAGHARYLKPIGVNKADINHINVIARFGDRVTGRLDAFALIQKNRIDRSSSAKR